MKVYGVWMISNYGFERSLISLYKDKEIAEKRMLNEIERLPPQDKAEFDSFGIISGFTFEVVEHSVFKSLSDFS